MNDPQRIQEYNDQPALWKKVQRATRHMEQQAIRLGISEDEFARRLTLAAKAQFEWMETLRNVGYQRGANPVTFLRQFRAFRNKKQEEGGL